MSRKKGAAARVKIHTRAAAPFSNHLKDPLSHFQHLLPLGLQFHQDHLDLFRRYIEDLQRLGQDQPLQLFPGNR